ncbi:MAG: TldD/PmbA family protein [Nanoarchaeota archaeon]|nr:TldD/PmbA family protein [Nanoarchaeota archaeon]
MTLAEFAVEQGKTHGAGFVDARLENTRSRSFILKNGIPELGSLDERKGIGIRLIIDGRQGFCSTNNLTKKALTRLIRRAASTARHSGKTSLAKAQPVKRKMHIKQKQKLFSVSPEENLSYLAELDSVAKGLPLRYFSFFMSQTDTVYASSEGAHIESSKPYVGLHTVFTVGKKVTMQRHMEKVSIGGYENVKKWCFHEALAGEICALTKNIEKGTPCPKGNIDVVASPEVVGIIVHESGGHPYEADRILGREAAQAGESFITLNMRGKAIGNSMVDVVDDPTVRNSAGYYQYDDEGVKARRKYLMKAGRINEFLHSRETAGSLGIRSNGSARASAYNREPIPRMSNTFMLPGTHKFDELLDGIKKGVFIKSFMEWNIDDRRVHQKYVGNEAYLIEDGEITVPVRQPVLELSTHTLYRSIDAISDKVELFAGTCGKGEPMQGMPVTMGGPSIRLRKIRVGR